MRARALAIGLFVAGCNFGSPSSLTPVKDAAGDGPADGPVDARPIDGAPGNAYRKQITIDPARVTGNQSAFPVWIVLAADNNLMARAAGNGADIHFTRPDGMPLAYQIQRWTKSTGHLEAWVRVDLDDSAPTVLDLRYGDPGTAHPPNPPVVFSSSFLAVWHLDDQLGNTTIAEATNQRIGTAQGGLGTSDQVAAQLGGGVDFDGNDDRITFVNPFAGGGDHTISAWVNQRTATGFDSIVTVGNSQGGESRWFHSHFFNNTASTGFFGPDWAGPALPNLEGNGWVLLHWVFNGTTRESRVYLDGALVGSHTFGAGTINTQGTGGHLGYALDAWGPGGSSPAALNGILDEVRLSTAERGPGWIATEHANQRMPQLFYAVGPEQPVP